MANTKISALPSGNPALTGDLIPIARSGANYSITPGSIALLAPQGTVTSVTFTGDGTVLSSTPSSAVTTSGTLTAALANAAAKTVLGNTSGSSGAPSYTTNPACTSLTLTDTAANTDFSMSNTTAATSSVSQSSPILSIGGKYWTGAASASDTWTLQNVLANGTNGASIFTFTHSGTSGSASISIPGGTNNNPGLSIQGSTGGIWSFSGGLAMAYSTTQNPLFLFNNVVRTQVGAVIGWASGDPTGSGADTGFSRDSAGVVDVGTGAAGSKAGSINLTNLTATGTITQGSSGQLVAGTSGTVTKYNNVATVSAGISAEYATVDLTAQSAAIAATTLYAVPAAGAGMYRVSCYAKITTASDISSTLGGATGFQLTWTDNTDSTTPTVTFSDISSQSLTGNTTTTIYSTIAIIYAKASTNVQYAFGYTDAHTSTAMAYKISVKLEAL